jgi:restriction system protein
MMPNNSNRALEERFSGPSYSDMMPFLFQAMKDLGGSGTISEINERTTALLALPDHIINYPHANTNRTEIEYRLAWTRTYLKKAGVLESASRAVWTLTPAARLMDHIDPKAIVDQVRQMTALSQKVDLDEPHSHDDNLENDNIEIPEEMQGWRDKLRNIVLNISPDAFERLTQRLLRESGFTQVIVTGRSGDGGIDGTGIVKLNGIISFHMLFQCKRYDGAVSAGDMRDFRGAMQGRADKGVFITTGTFTKAAMQEAKRAGTNPIDLINGEELIDRLRDLKLGVQAVTDFAVDEGWFVSL